jgi:hypothetical protein
MARTVLALESPPSLWLGCVLGFRRVFAESLARVVCLGSAESPPSLRRGCVLGFRRVSATRIRDSLSRSGVSGNRR